MSDAKSLLENRNKRLYNAHDLPHDAMLMVKKDFTRVEIHVAKSTGHIGHDTIYIDAASDHSLANFDSLTKDKTMCLGLNIQPKVTQLP